MAKNQAIISTVEKMANLASSVKANYVPISQLDAFKKVQILWVLIQIKGVT